MDFSGLARTLARRASAHRYMGNYQASIQDGMEALELSQGDKSLESVRAGALRATGMSHYHQADLNECV